MESFSRAALAESALNAAIHGYKRLAPAFPTSELQLELQSICVQRSLWQSNASARPAQIDDHRQAGKREAGLIIRWITTAGPSSCRGCGTAWPGVRSKVASSVRSVTKTQARTMFVTGLGIARV